MLSDEGLRQEAQFFAAQDGLGATGGTELLEGARTMRLDRVFGNEKLRRDLAIAEATGDQGKNSSSRAVMPRVCWLAELGVKGLRAVASPGTSTSINTASWEGLRLRAIRSPSHMPNVAKRMATSAT